MSITIRSMTAFADSSPGNTTGALTYPVAVSSGDILIVQGEWGNGTMTGVTDSLGNTYTILSTNGIQFAYTTSSTSGTCTQSYTAIAGGAGNRIFNLVDIISFGGGSSKTFFDSPWTGGFNG